MGQLAQRIRAKYPGAYDDMDDAALEKAVLAKHPEYADLAQPEQPKAQAQPEQPQGDLGRFGGYKMLGDAVINAGKAAINHPVQSLAMLGGIAAAPLTGGGSLAATAAASGLGAAGGAGIGSIINALRGGENGPQTAGDVAKTMATEGALGAAGEGIGKGISAGLSKGAYRLYRGVLRPSVPLQREFGDIAATGLREGIPISERGAKTAADKLGQSAATARQMVADAAPTASKIRPVTEVGSETKPLVARAKIRARTGLSDESPAIVGRVKALSKQNPGGIGLEDAQAMKGELQDLAGSVYRAQDKGMPVLDLSADTNAALARGLRQSIESRVPGVGPVNQRTQDLIGLKHAMENANSRNLSIGIKSLIGDTTPGLMSGAAILGDRSARFPFNDALKTALIAALGGQD